MQTKQRILIIDDNPAIHQDFRKIFDPAGVSQAFDDAEAALFGGSTATPIGADFMVDSAFQGREGLALTVAARAEGDPYALAFVDVRMPPGWDGVETIGHLWEADPELQIVICTAYSDYSWDEMIEKVGKCDRLVILKKPFDNIEVLQMAHALTAKWELARQVKRQIDNLEHLVAERSAALDRSEAHFRVIAENVADMVSVLDRGGVGLYHSPSYEKSLGIGPASLTGGGWLARFHAEDRERVSQAIKSVAQTGEGQALECRILHGDGSWRVLETYLDSARQTEGGTEHLVLVSRDITARRRGEEERVQIELQLRHAQKMESIGQLAAGIAHEINTPAQYIGDNTRFLQDAFRDLHGLLQIYGRLAAAVEDRVARPEILREAESGAAAIDLKYLLEEVPKAIEQSLSGLNHISRIVGAMKDFSHPGSREKSATDLNRAIESAITVATHEWKYVCTVATEFAPDLPLVFCLPGEFNQVILNMIVNASHAIGDVVGDGARGKGVITIATRVDGAWAEVRIQDTGAGMPAEILEKIFEPFFTTKGVGKGTGQGLAIAHSVIVDKHRGEIEVESEPGKGTVFILRLPLGPAGMERKAA